MSKSYKLIAINDSSKELVARQKGIQTKDVILGGQKETVWMGRAGGDNDFKIPAQLVQYSSKHCKLEYSEEVSTE